MAIPMELKRSCVKAIRNSDVPELRQFEHGADVNAYFLGSNGLSLAIQRNHTEIVSYLRSVGAKTPAEQGWKSSSQ